ncbi:nucleotide exchange factor GrpE [Candidatus Wolfebacteria bacterium]|nr:nucleotide exchange factor GrpE [Candidatus Wolfebacteria bacterium]
MTDDSKKENLEEEKADKIEERIACQKERGEYLDGWKRAKADLANYKKDEAKRFEEIIKFSQSSLVRDLITVLDSFDLAILALESQTRIHADSPQARINAETDRANNDLKGMYLIRTQLEDILRKNGLERILISAGDQFDPRVAEVIAQVESEKPSGTIVEEVERGYLLNGKLIRPARVKVAK